MTKTPEEIAAAFEKRLNVYRMKREAADPFARDVYTRHEAVNYVIEAIELLAIECGIPAIAPFLIEKEQDQ